MVLHVVSTNHFSCLVTMKIIFYTPLSYNIFIFNQLFSAYMDPPVLFLVLSLAQYLTYPGCTSQYIIVKLV